MGGAGLDSWANIYLRHVDSLDEQKTGSITLADGSKAPCRTYSGDKGCPMALVLRDEDADQIDLLPQQWLCERGCDVQYDGLSGTLTTPKGTKLDLKFWQSLPYLSSDQIVVLFRDLPEAHEKGRSGRPAGDSVACSAIQFKGFRVCGARLRDETESSGQPRSRETPGALQTSEARRKREERKKLRQILYEQNLTRDQVEHAVNKYKCMEDAYYTDTDDYLKPEDVLKTERLKKYDLSIGRPVRLWEWYAGSGSLTSTAKMAGVSHLPPIDRRWGWDLSYGRHQVRALVGLIAIGAMVLHASPTCTCWSGHSRGWTPAKRQAARDDQHSTLQFLSAASTIQYCLGRDFLIENPAHSQIWQDSPLRYLEKLDTQMVKFDQCMFGAKVDGKCARKKTEVLSSFDVSGLERRCDGSHDHVQLRGNNSIGTRTAQTAVYPNGLCNAILGSLQTIPDGGRGTVYINVDSSKTFELKFLSILAEIRVLGLRLGISEVWENTVDPWLRINLPRFPHPIPLLPVDATLHLVSSESAEVRNQEGVQKVQRACAVQFETLKASSSVLCEIRDALQKLEEKVDRLHREPERPRAAAGRQDSIPKYVKDLLQDGDGTQDDPFTDRSIDPTDVDDFGMVGDAVPGDSGEGEVHDVDVTAGDAREKSGGDSAERTLATLVTGTTPSCMDIWQFKPYDVNSTTWLAAAQRRHAHRRRSNVSLGTACVDLSGPHEPTPTVGHRIGHKMGYYFCVLVIQADYTVGYSENGTQTIEEGEVIRSPDGDGQTPVAMLEGNERPQSGGKLPLVYCEIISKKSEASAAVQRLIGQVRDEHGSSPKTLVFRLHSDKGQEFCTHTLDRFCQHLGIHRTTTSGYDPSANGSGEQAVGFIKRKARQLLIGARLPTNWWGVACLSAAWYSRCAAGLLEWPRLGFGTRVLSVTDPTPRNAFLPRALPATLFCPSHRVPGGYIVFQNGHLREIVNVQHADLEPEDILFVKAHMHEWQEPVRPCDPPARVSWDAKLMDKKATDIEKVNPNQLVDPPEAEKVEEKPEPRRVRLEEMLDEIVDEDLDETRFPGDVRASATRGSTYAAQKVHGRRRKDSRSTGERWRMPHACVALSTASEIHSEAVSTLQSETDSIGPTDVPNTTEDEIDLLDLTFDDDDDDVIGGVIEMVPDAEVSEESTNNDEEIDDANDEENHDENYENTQIDVEIPSDNLGDLEDTVPVQSSGNLEDLSDDDWGLGITVPESKVREKKPRGRSPAKSSRTPRKRTRKRPTRLTGRKLRACAACADPPPSIGQQQEEDDALSKWALNLPKEEPGTTTIQEREIKQTGKLDWEQWTLAANAELIGSFYEMNAVSIATKAEIEKCDRILPMKCVWTQKANGTRKCRGVICGNFQRKSDAESVYTAQAETASLMAAVRLSQLKGWTASKLDVKGAFMHAPMPDGLTVVVRPPSMWVEMGLVPRGTLDLLQGSVRPEDLT